MVRAWYMDDNDNDQREPHQLNPPEYVSLEKLEQLGVKYWWFDPSTYDKNLDYQKLKHKRGYSYQDKIVVSPKHMENYEFKIKSFYDEHIHTDEEIRFVLDGSGYFDVRDLDDKWIRIEVGRGDMIVLPAGIFHRFTLDTKNYIEAIRLFIGEPVWTPHSRQNLEANHPSVEGYRQAFGQQVGSEAKKVIS